jgi:GAF domain-containing protein
VPLLIDGRLVGVLDIDSPSVGRFSAEDQTGIEGLCAAYCASQSGDDPFI